MPREHRELLETQIVGKALEAYGYYELGDADDDLVGRGVGVPRDELKEVLVYDDVERVRWEHAISPNHVERLADRHDLV